MGGATDAIVQGGGVLGAVFIFCMLAMGSAFTALALYTKSLHKDFIDSQEKCKNELTAVQNERIKENIAVRQVLLDVTREFNATQREQIHAGAEVEGKLTETTDATERVGASVLSAIERLTSKIETLERAVHEQVRRPPQGGR